MLPRQDIVTIFSTFVQFDCDRFNSWATDPRLRRSMQQHHSQVERASENFWTIYWHKLWHQQPQSIAKQHLAAYLQEVCYWSASKTITGFSNTQYGVADCFQLAILEIERVLNGFDRERGFNLKSYASITFGNVIRELLRQKKELDICSDWSLLRKLSQKRLTESLSNAGLDETAIERYVLACNCLKTIYVPERANSTRKLPKPQPETWQAIAELYNQERQKLSSPGDSATAASIEKAVFACVRAARSYLFPSVTSIDKPKPGYDSGTIADSLVGEVDDSLLTEMIASEEVARRSQQQTDINQFLTTTIEALNAEDRELLELYYARQLKQSQIAKQLNTQQYSISRKLSKVRKTLLKSLAVWSKDTMHISLTSDILKSISSLLEEWLASYYSKE
ncbi:sigma-70 family RNA polymerase sigma factor [Myxosarcina sp. GI1]|uniref:sigma-70 family RNA polymerase sigma factor n=1 Tax=Myxosarcina sp. GI1 TaxID=1541065 RepID=UPI00056A4162|nr:sigma-70 family RNA polymerase sigma factor [Myxosarcina sp. GI1]